MVWLMTGAWAVIDVITYSRIDPDDLYHVSNSGLGGGLGRALVFLNFPAALAAIAIVVLVADRTAWRWPHVLSIVLCAVIVVPGVVDEGDLDAKWINVVPALGVAIALVLTLRAGRGGWGDPRGDPIRIAVAIVLAILALPWMFSLAGFYFPGSDVIYHDEARVHLGEHHGLEGYLLVLTALLLSRELPRMRRPHAPRGVPLPDDRVRRREHGQRRLVRAGREARLDRLAHTERAPAERHVDVGARDRGRRGDLLHRIATAPRPRGNPSPERLALASKTHQDP